MPTIHNDGSLNYIEDGDGPVVILLHGISASRYDWEALLPELVRAGYRVLAVDLLGHGDSPKPEHQDAYAYPAFYASFTAWLEKLNLPEPVSLVGHSLGGHLSLAYSLEFPERVRGLVLINPLYSLRQLSPVLRLFHRRPEWGAKAVEFVPLEVIDWLLAWDPINLAGFSAQTRHQIAMDYKRASPQIFRIAPTIPDLTPRLSLVPAPTLVIWGQRDLTLDPASFPRLVKALPEGNAHCIPGCGHQPHVGRPEYVNQLILNYLDGILKAAPEPRQTVMLNDIP